MCDKDKALAEKEVGVIRFFTEHRPKLLSVLLLIVILMNFARYIFKFGSPSSSLNYSHTPIAFWIIRYCLVALIFLIFASAWKRLRVVEWVGFTVLALSSIYALTETESDLIKIAAFHLSVTSFLFLTIRSMGDGSAAEYVDYFVNLFYGLAIIFALILALQIFLYFAFDVLPSHSHANSILIRFGSIFDDSLAFGILLPMFVGFFFYGIKDDFMRFVGLMAIILISVLTGSLTAMATTAIYTLYLMRVEWRRLLVWGLMLMLLLVAFHWYFLELWSAKLGSIAGHMDGLQIIFGNDGGLQGENFAESGWILLFKNFGIFALLVIFGFHLYIHFLCMRTLHSVYGYRQYVGAVEGLNFSAFFASFNLPVLMIFPVYFLLAIFSAILCGVAGGNGVGLKS